MKRVVSLLMSALLIWTTTGAVLPAVTADALPAPYAWLDTADGTLRTSDGVTVAPLGQHGRVDVLSPEAEEYGIRLDADWSGFVVGGDIFVNVPAGEGAVLAVEYYAQADMSADLQLFRYQLGGGYGDGSHVDLFSFRNDLVGYRSGLLLIPFSALQIAAARADASYTLQLMACPGGKEITYIQSMRLVAPQYTAATADGCEYIEFSERVVCDYYPEITAIPFHDMSHRDLEQVESLPDVPWLYRYVQVHGASYTPDETARRAVYIKLYAAAGHENDTVDIAAIEREANAWGDGATVQMIDGVGGVFLPSVCFGNRLNGVGSFRFVWTEAPKVARIEVYDVDSYCADGAGDAAMTALFHQERLHRNVGVAVVGQRAPTVEAEGYTGDIVCAACGEMLQAGQTLPKSELPLPYAWLTTDDGTLWAGGGTRITPLGDSGNIAVSAIGETAEYGIRLEADWSGFSFEGDVLANVPAGADVVLAIGYYIDSDETGHMFRYQIGAAPYEEVYSASHALVTRRAGVLLIPLAADEVAAWRESETQQLRLLGCTHGAKVTYIQSIRVVATEYTAIPDVGCAYVDTAERVLCSYEPNAIGRPCREMVCGEYEVSEDHPDRPWLYRYYTVQGRWLANEEAADRPIYIKIYAAAGYENDRIKIDSIEREANAWGNGATVQMVDGEGGVYVPYTAFTNGLNGLGSFRFWWTEAEKVARVELYDAATYCLDTAADTARVAWLHERMRAERFGVTIENYREPTADEVGDGGDIRCAACGVLLEKGKEIPRLPDSGLPAPYGRLETVTGVTWTSDGFDVTPFGAAGNHRTMPIGNTGKYGIRLDADWSGFALTGEAFRTVPQGESAVLAIEYYIDTVQQGQMFRYKVGGNPQVDFHSAPSNLTHQASALVLCVLTPEEIALLAGGEPLFVLGCPGGAEVTYIQSVMVVAPQYAAGADVGRDRVALAEVPLCDYYPDMTGRYNYGMRYADVRDGYDENGALRRHTYFEVTHTLAADDAAKTPVTIRFTFKEDSTVQQFSLDYQCGRPTSLLDESVWQTCLVTVTDGVAEVRLADACFTNGLYEIGSFRVPNTAATPAADQLKTVEVTAMPSPTVTAGDVDGSGRVDSTDARLTLQYAVQKITADGLEIAAADVDGSGRVDSTDARLILQYAVMKIDEFPKG